MSSRASLFIRGGRSVLATNAAESARLTDPRNHIADELRHVALAVRVRHRSLFGCRFTRSREEVDGEPDEGEKDEHGLLVKVPSALPSIRGEAYAT